MRAPRDGYASCAVSSGSGLAHVLAAEVGGDETESKRREACVQRRDCCRRDRCRQKEHRFPISPGGRTTAVARNAIPATTTRPAKTPAPDQSIGEWSSDENSYDGTAANEDDQRARG